MQVNGTNCEEIGTTYQDGKFKHFLIDINTEELPSSMDALISSLCSSLRTLYHQQVYSSELARLSAISRDATHAQKSTSLGNISMKTFKSSLITYL